MISNDIKKIVFELVEEGLKKTEIAKRVKLSRSSIYRILNESEDYEPELEYSKDDELVLSLNNQFLEEGYDLENEVKRLTYELVVLSGDFKMTSFDYLKDQIAIVKKYQQLEGDAIKKYDFFWDISQNMDLITDNYDVSKLYELIDNFIDREIYLEELEGVISENEVLLKKTRKELVILNKKKESVLKEIAEAKNYKNQFAIAVKGGMQIKKLEERIEFMQVALTGFIKTYPDIENLWIGYTDNLSKKFNKLKK